MEQTRLDIGTIGQKLEYARQEKGVTASEAGHETKILLKYIEAMEADNFEVISAPIYIKGFIKIYAQFLGLDPEPLVQEYAATLGTAKKAPLPEEVRHNLAQADRAVSDTSAGGNEVFGGVHKGVGKLGLSPKVIAAAVGAAILLLVIVISVTQCSDTEEPVPTLQAQGNVPVQPRELLYKEQPDVYLRDTGEIDVAK